MENSQDKQIVSAIVVFDGKILLLQRNNTPGIRDPECWQLPGGGVEENETPDIAISRELQEEISIAPKTVRFLITPYPKTHVYYVPLTEDEVTNVKIGNEGKDLRFFSLDEMSTIPLTQKLRIVLETQQDTLKSLLQ